MNKKLIGAVGIIFLVILSGIVVAKENKSIEFAVDNEGKFTVKNIGQDPIYVLDELSIIDNKKNIINTIQDFSSGTILKIYPGKSYSWELDNIDEGEYKIKIFCGKNKETLTSVYTDKFSIKKPKAKVKFYTDKKIYHVGEYIELTMSNHGTVPVYVHVPDQKSDPWVIKKLGKGDIIYIDDCDNGYGYDCSYTVLDPGEEISHIWDQKNNDGKQVSPGIYKAYARYTTQNPETYANPKMEKKTTVFNIKKQHK